VVTTYHWISYTVRTKVRETKRSEKGLTMKEWLFIEDRLVPSSFTKGYCPASDRKMQRRWERQRITFPN